MDLRQMDDKVTIITPTWLREANIIHRCMKCVDAQTHENWEHIVCSDGSKETSVEHLIASNRNEKRRYACLDSHYGDYANVVRHTMLQQAEGKYVMFLDDDNIILPNYLEKMIAVLEDAYIKDKRIGFAICKIFHFGPLPEHLGIPPKILDGIPPSVQNIDTLQVLAFTEAMKNIGWNLEAGYLADGYTFEEMAVKYDWTTLPEVLGIHL